MSAKKKYSEENTVGFNLKFKEFTKFKLLSEQQLSWENPYGSTNQK